MFLHKTNPMQYVTLLCHAFVALVEISIAILLSIFVGMTKKCFFVMSLYCYSHMCCVHIDRFFNLFFG